MSIYDPQSQRDARWANEELGTVAGATIGAYGCFITSAAMIATHYLGTLITPHVVNQALIAKHLYASGDLWVDSSLSLLYPQIQLEAVWNYAGVPADLSKLSMDDTQERLIVLDFDHIPSDGIQTHAVRAFSWDGHTLIIDDPWYGSRDNFSLHYGTNPALTIQKIVGYKVPSFVPPWKRPSPPVVVPPLTADAVYKLLASNGVTGANADIGVAVCHAESGFRPDAQNSAGNTPPSVDRGLWQINSYWHPEVSDVCAYDSVCATKEAVRIAKGGTDWSAWNAYNNGSYKQYLPVVDPCITVKAQLADSQAQVTVLTTKIAAAQKALA